jgi:hypothetical protein
MGPSSHTLCSEKDLISPNALLYSGKQFGCLSFHFDSSQSGWHWLARLIGPTAPPRGRCPEVPNAYCHVIGFLGFARTVRTVNSFNSFNVWYITSEFLPDVFLSRYQVGVTTRDCSLYKLFPSASIRLVVPPCRHINLVVSVESREKKRETDRRHRLPHGMRLGEIRQ